MIILRGLSILMTYINSMKKFASSKSHFIILFLLYFIFLIRIVMKGFSVVPCSAGRSSVKICLVVAEEQPKKSTEIFDDSDWFYLTQINFERKLPDFILWSVPYFIMIEKYKYYRMWQIQLLSSQMVRMVSVRLNSQPNSFERTVHIQCWFKSQSQLESRFLHLNIWT